MQKGQDIVYDACLFKQCLPCQGPQQEIHPHWQNEDKYHKTVLPFFHSAQYHGKRVGKEQANEGGDQRKHQSQKQGLQMFRTGDGGNVLEGKNAVFICKTIVKYHTKRRQYKDQAP